MLSWMYDGFKQGVFKAKSVFFSAAAKQSIEKSIDPIYIYIYKVENNTVVCVIINTCGPLRAPRVL